MRQLLERGKVSVQSYLEKSKYNVLYALMRGRPRKMLKECSN